MIRPSRPSLNFWLAVVVLSFCPAWANAQDGWTGNFAVNPGFEEDFVNVNSESQVLSFKGDWYYNQKDLVPDYWDLKGKWTWNHKGAHSGSSSLKLDAGAVANQDFQRAMFQSGGGAWGGVNNAAIPVSKPEEARFAQPWRVTVWARGGGKLSVTCGKKTLTAAARGSGNWEQLVLELPVADIGAPSASLVISLQGPGEFDDVVVQERLPDVPNLVANGTFEQADAKGYPAGWSQQKKWLAIGPTYYVWTDWNHVFRDNRGAVTTDSLVSNTGRQSLRFNVHPGDEKYVESDLIVLNQDSPHVLEAGVWVRADRINLIDIRMVDQDGDYMPGYRPRQPENQLGGSFLFGNGTFGWRYVRKFFGTPNNQPVKGVRVRLCARGFNGHTLDDFGTRSYCSQVGTVWWDDVRVVERTTDGNALRNRGAKVPSQPSVAAGTLVDGSVDLGERLWGQNTLAYTFKNNGGQGTFQVRLTTTFPGGKPVVTTSKPYPVANGATQKIAANYVVEKLAADVLKQGHLHVELLQDNKPVATETYAFNTWPVITDIDVSRSYNYPNENPVRTSINLGVSSQTLSQVTTLKIELYRHSDKKVISTQTVEDLPAAFAKTIDFLPKSAADSFEFNFPTPAWWVDRTNLLLLNLNLNDLKVHPHDNPVRDTVLIVRGLDRSGKELFVDHSDPFGRMQPPPAQPAIESVKIREDGALLINGEPRFLTGATHQHIRMPHTIPRIAQLGLMGHRLTQGMKNEEMLEMFTKYHLYCLQAKPDPSLAGTAPVTSMTPQQKKNFEAWIAQGGMKNVVSINTGGWEATIDFHDPKQVAAAKAINEYIHKVANRPTCISTSGAYNAWWLNELTIYDINQAETEMWGPMDFNTIFTPYMKKAGKVTAWAYLPQLYDNTPYERYRFETYENIVRGSCGTSMIQGIGDPTFNRGLAGELRYLEKPLNSLDPAPKVTLQPNVSHKATSYQGKTFLLTTNAGPVQCGNWKWNTEIKHSGRASHEGDSVNKLWYRPGGVRIHGFRGMPLPEMIKKGDKIVQYVWLDPKETPDWVAVAVRGDGRFSHVGVLGNFNYETFRQNYGNVLMFSELEHSVWHTINWVMDDAHYKTAVKVMGKAEADQIRNGAIAGRKGVDEHTYKAGDFKNLGAAPAAGKWVKIEIDADAAGLTGKLVDGLAFLSHNGRALWDYSVLERNGKVVRNFCEDSVGIDRAELAKVKINVPGLKKGTKVKVLFEDRTITADEGGFHDNFEGIDTYGYEGDAVEGDLLGFVRDEDRQVVQMMPSGYGYKYGPTAVHIYEIAP